MNIAQAKALPILSIVERMGATLSHQRGDDAWFFSPFREEKTASFHINTKRNIWYDFGQPEESSGGNGIDLVCAYLKMRGENATAKEALAWLSGKCSNPFPATPSRDKSQSSDPGWTFKGERPVTHQALIHYLERRGIPMLLAKKHLRQVYAVSRRTGKGVIALGFKNEDGGYELRNSFLKSAIAPKAITFIRGAVPKPDTIHMFEGFMDYLSATLQSKNGQLDGDCIVLNSLSLVSQSLAYMKGYGYRLVCSWLDNDAAGDRAALTVAKFVKTEEGMMMQRMNPIYKGHQDVNAWHMHKSGLPSP